MEVGVLPPARVQKIIQARQRQQFRPMNDDQVHVTYPEMLMPCCTPVQQQAPRELARTPVTAVVLRPVQLFQRDINFAARLAGAFGGSHTYDCAADYLEILALEGPKSYRMTMHQFALTG